MGRKSKKREGVCIHIADSGFPGSSVGKESHLQCRKPWLDSWVRKIPREGLGYPLQYSWASLVAQMVKNLPPVRVTWVRSLGREDPLEEGMTTHPSILAWIIPWTEEPGGLQSLGWQRVGRDWTTEHSVADALRSTVEANSIGKPLCSKKKQRHMTSDCLKSMNLALIHLLVTFLASSFCIHWSTAILFCCHFIVKESPSHLFMYVCIYLY